MKILNLNTKINIRYFCPCGKERIFNNESEFSTSRYDDTGSYICEHGNWIIPQTKTIDSLPLVGYPSGVAQTLNY